MFITFSICFCSLFFFWLGREKPGIGTAAIFSLFATSAGTFRITFRSDGNNWETVANNHFTFSSFVVHVCLISSKEKAQKIEQKGQNNYEL